MTQRTLIRRLLSTSVLVLVPALAQAQDPRTAPDSLGPRGGSWGAELGIGSGQSATLLRFGSSASALLLGVEVFWIEVSEDAAPFGGAEARTYTLANVTGRLGHRWYHSVTRAARPFTSLGLLAGYSRDPGGPGWTAGGFAEMGASYFFTPHVSLGAAGGLQAVYTRLKREFSSGTTITTRTIGVRASAVQLLGAVYF
jgi:hypothetical protein